MRSSLLPLSLLASTLALSLAACSGSDDGSSSTDTDSGAAGDTAIGGDSAKTDSSTSGDSAKSDSTTGDSASSDTATGGDSTAGDSATGDASDTATGSDSVADGPGEAAPDGLPPSCSSDADCRTYSVECAGECRCLALASTDPDPTCTDPTECFADPCGGKRAVCNPAGLCVVE